jgi:hypothetical protein
MGRFHRPWDTPFLGEIIGSLGRTAACRLKSGHRFHHVCRCFGLWREHLLRTAKCPGALPPPQQRMEHRKTSPAKLASVVAANFTSSVTAPVVRRLFWNRVTTILPNLGASPMEWRPIYSMVNAVLFGAGLIFVLPGLSADAGFWISVVVGASLILAAPIAWWIAPRLCAHFGNRRAEGTTTAGQM